MKKYTINNLYYTEMEPMCHCDTYGMDNLVKKCESDNLEECKANLLRLEEDFIEEIKESAYDETVESIYLIIFDSETDETYYEKNINLEEVM